MGTLTISVPDTLLEAFHSKFAPGERDDVLRQALIDLVQQDPYSAEAFAEDDRLWKQYREDGGGSSTEQVIERLNAQLRRAGLPCAE